MIAGIEFVVKNCAAASLKCIANMSLGGGFSTSLNTAVNNAVDLGITFVVAAGNSNANACNYSPAAASKAITVGAITSSDTLASFTNWGCCVDIYAPGVDIKAASIDNNTATNTKMGTSMASPHVCGLAAAALQSDKVPETYLKDYATKKTIDCSSPGTGISVNPDVNLNCSSTVSQTCPSPIPACPP
jgi:subtilisin family serine protease